MSRNTTSAVTIVLTLLYAGHARMTSAQAARESAEQERAYVSGAWECVDTGTSDTRLPTEYRSQKYSNDTFEVTDLNGVSIVYRTDGSVKREETACTSTDTSVWSGTTLRMVRTAKCGATDSESVMRTDIAPGASENTLAITSSMTFDKDVLRSAQRCTRISDARFEQLSSEWAMKSGRRQKAVANLVSFLSGLGQQTLDRGTIEYRVSGDVKSCEYDKLTLTSIATVPLSVNSQTGVMTRQDEVALSFPPAADPLIFRPRMGGPNGQGNNPGLFVLAGTQIASQESKVEAGRAGGKELGSTRSESAGYTFYFSPKSSDAPAALQKLIEAAQQACREP